MRSPYGQPSDRQRQYLVDLFARLNPQDQQEFRATFIDSYGGSTLRTKADYSGAISLALKLEAKCPTTA